jgi:hypothetical protein
MMQRTHISIALGLGILSVLAVHDIAVGRRGLANVAYMTNHPKRTERLVPERNPELKPATSEPRHTPERTLPPVFHSVF